MEVPFGEARVGYVDDQTSLQLRGSFRDTLFPCPALEARFFFPSGFFWQAESDDGLQKEHTVEMSFSPSLACIRVWEHHQYADVPSG